MNPPSTLIHVNSGEIANDEHEEVAHMKQIAMVVLSSDDKLETKLHQRRFAQPRRRLPTPAHRFHVPRRSAVLTISSDSSEEKTMDVEDPKLVQSFGALNIGEKLPTVTSSTNLVTVEVQTEISISLMIFLDPMKVDMVLNREASIEILGKSSVLAVLSPPHALQLCQLWKTHQRISLHHRR